MKHLKIIGLAMVAAAVMAFAGASTASATTLTKSGTFPNGTPMVVGETITATAEESLTLRAGFANVTCTESAVGGKITNAGGSSATVVGTIEEMTFTNCGSYIVTVINKGTLEVHTQNNSATNNGNGTLTSTGAEVTTALGSTSCTYGTPTAKDLGTLTGSKNTGSTATFDIETELSKTAGGFLCANPAKWEGKYKVTTPDYLDVD